MIQVCILFKEILKSRQILIFDDILWNNENSIAGFWDGAYYSGFLNEWRMAQDRTVFWVATGPAQAPGPVQTVLACTAGSCAGGRSSQARLRVFSGSSASFANGGLDLPGTLWPWPSSPLVRSQIAKSLVVSTLFEFHEYSDAYVLHVVKFHGARYFLKLLFIRRVIWTYR